MRFEVGGSVRSFDLFFCFDRPAKEDQDALLRPNDRRRTRIRGPKPVGPVFFVGLSYL